MNVLEYERRVKKFACPEDKGFVSKVQLLESFKDVDVFGYMHDSDSLQYKFITSTFFADFSVGSGLTIPLQMKPLASKFPQKSPAQVKRHRLKTAH